MKQKASARKKRLLSSLLLAGIVTGVLAPMFQLPRVYASGPIQIAPDSGINPSDYLFQLTDYANSYVKLGANFYADGVQISGTYVNFTNMALGSAASPTQTFGVGVEGGNTTISSVGSGTVTLTMSCTAAAVCYAYYYYAGGLPVFAVQTTIGTTTSQIQQPSFTSDIATFDSMTSPSVYQNTSASYLKVKVTYSTPTTISFYLGTGSTSGTGGSGSNAGMGSGSNSGSSGGVVITNPPVGSALQLDVQIPTYNVRPGESVTLPMTIKWIGATKIVVTNIEFAENPSWFKVERQLPFPAVMDYASQTSTTTVPVTVLVPQSEQGLQKTIDVRVTATIGSVSAQQITPLVINLIPPNDLIMYAGVVGALVLVVGIAKRRRR